MAEKNKLMLLFFFIPLLIENSRFNWNLKINFTNTVSLYNYKKIMTTENTHNKLLIVN